MGLYLGSQKISGDLPSSGLAVPEPTAPICLPAMPPCGIQVAGAYERYYGKWVGYITVNDQSNVLTALSFPDLEGIYGLGFFAMSINGGSGVTSASFPSLVAVLNNSFSPFNSRAIQSYDFQKLRYAGNNLSFQGNASATITSLSLPSLEHVTNTLTMDTLPLVSAIDISKLKVVGGLTVSLASLVTLSAPLLSHSTGAISFEGSTALTTASFPRLAFYNSSFSASNNLGNLANFTLPVDGTLKFFGGNFTITGQKLTQQSVDNILSALASLNGTNGTTSYGSGRVVNVSGGTSAAPTDLGSVTTPGSNFSCSGTTCTVTLTAHGYTTGDVLRVSGVTTATNANRYAVITVTGDNTFTYTITSQTATGAGTATIRKADNDVKALVTRGVTLTTN